MKQDLAEVDLSEVKEIVDWTYENYRIKLSEQQAVARVRMSMLTPKMNKPSETQCWTPGCKKEKERPLSRCLECQTTWLKLAADTAFTAEQQDDIDKHRQKRARFTATTLVQKFPSRPTDRLHSKVALEKSAGAGITAKNATTKDALQCVSCMDKNFCVVLKPCCHLCLCVDCSLKVENCPMCRTPIASKENIFIVSSQ